MLQKTKRSLICIALCFTVVASVSGSNARNETYQASENDRLQTLLKKKLQYYRAQYPEILILNLEGGVDFPADLVALDLVLGFQPVSLDYEHPPELRKDLMVVSFERIISMLRYQAPSAALFKADDPLGWQEHVCVLTIDPRKIAADSNTASQHLLSLPPEAIRNIPRDFKLLSGNYLEFVIDHEIYHCLKSMYVGPQQRSHMQFWAEYNQFVEEQGADAYALGMHIKLQGEITPFTANIRRIRGMSLYNADPDHLTCKALERVLELPVEDLVNQLRAAVGQAPLTAEGSNDEEYLRDHPEWFDVTKISARVTEGEDDDPDKMTIATLLPLANALGPDEIVELVTSFVPAPGIDILRKKGFEVWSVQGTAEEIRTYVARPRTA